MNLRGFFDDNDAIVVGDAAGERVQQRRLSGPSSTGDQDIPLAVDRGDEQASGRRRERANLDEFIESVAARELTNRQRRTAPSMRSSRRH
jgi:hypothetical protein